MPEAHGQTPLLDRLGARIVAAGGETMALMKNHGLIAAIRNVNEPAHIAADHDFYRQMLRLGSVTEQPGVELLTAWYHRNFLICANLIQTSRPGDHIVVFYGAGHAFLLRQCVSETPGFQLVDANAYLPK